MKNRLLSIISLVLLLSAPNLLAAVPNTISYQGYLTDDAGDPVEGAQSVTFMLYDITSTQVWTETLNVTVTSGVFEATLGATTPLPNPLLTGVSLGLTFGVNPKMTPRQQLNSTPFAIHAKATESGTVSYDLFADDIGADGIKLYGGSLEALSTSSTGGISEDTISDADGLNSATPSRVLEKSTGIDWINPVYLGQLGISFTLIRII